MDPEAKVAIASLIVVLLYLIESNIWPYTACGKCKGKGRFWSPFTMSWRNCPRCNGGGKKTRLGRRLFEREEKKEGRW